jgi:hypothetical protein
MGLGHHCSLRIKNKSWTAGVSDKTKANYTVSQKLFEAELTWKDNMKPTIEPFVDSKGYQGIRLKVEYIG